MRIGVVVPMSVPDGPGQVPTWPQVRTFGQHAEAVGLDSVWVCDHLLSGPPEEGMHEGWTILAALAASTRRLELGQLVMCTSFRHPALLAKMATTADTVSGARLILGLGAGWYDPEYTAFGYPTDHRVGQRLRSFLSKPQGADLVVLKELLEAGKVTPVIDRTFPLRETAEAISYVGERSTQGKTVITV